MRHVTQALPGGETLMLKSGTVPACLNLRLRFQQMQFFAVTVTEAVLKASASGTKFGLWRAFHTVRRCRFCPVMVDWKQFPAAHLAEENSGAE
jgi:hypothetical protein